MPLDWSNLRWTVVVEHGHYMEFVIEGAKSVPERVLVWKLKFRYEGKRDLPDRRCCQKDIVLGVSLVCPSPLSSPSPN